MRADPDSVEPTLADDKHVVIMADYSSSGINTEDRTEVDPSELPGSQALLDRIAAWAH